jgi:hypothetical protein
VSGAGAGGAGGDTAGRGAPALCSSRFETNANIPMNETKTRSAKSAGFGFPPPRVSEGAGGAVVGGGDGGGGGRLAGLPHDGQAGASDEIAFPQSGHFTRANATGILPGNPLVPMTRL